MARFASILDGFSATRIAFLFSQMMDRSYRINKILSL